MSAFFHCYPSCPFLFSFLSSFPSQVLWRQTFEGGSKTAYMTAKSWLLIVEAKMLAKIGWVICPWQHPSLLDNVTLGKNAWLGLPPKEQAWEAHYEHLHVGATLCSKATVLLSHWVSSPNQTLGSLRPSITTSGWPQVTTQSQGPTSEQTCHCRDQPCFDLMKTACEASTHQRHVRHEPSHVRVWKVWLFKWEHHQIHRRTS